MKNYYDRREPLDHNDDDFEGLQRGRRRTPIESNRCGFGRGWYIDPALLDTYNPRSLGGNWQETNLSDLESLWEFNPDLGLMFSAPDVRYDYYGDGLSTLIIGRKPSTSMRVVLECDEEGSFFRMNTDDQKPLSAILADAIDEFGYPHEDLRLDGVNVFMDENKHVPAVQFFVWFDMGWIQKGARRMNKQRPFEMPLANPERIVRLGQRVKPSFRKAHALWSHKNNINW